MNENYRTHRIYLLAATLPVWALIPIGLYAMSLEGLSARWALASLLATDTVLGILIALAGVWLSFRQTRARSLFWIGGVVALLPGLFLLSMRLTAG